MISGISKGILAALLVSTLAISTDADARDKEAFSIQMGAIESGMDLESSLKVLEDVSQANMGKGLINKYAKFKLVTHHITGLPISISGHFPTENRGFRPEKVAEEFLSKNRGAFGLNGEGVTLLKKSVTIDAAGLDHSRFSLFVQGVPVEGAEIIVHSEGSIVRSIDASLVQTEGLKLTVKIAPEDAQTLAEEDLKSRINSLAHLNRSEAARYKRIRSKDTPTLTWLAPGLILETAGATTPVWKVNVEGWLFFVSAETGKTLLAYDNMQTALYRSTFHANNGTILPGTLIIDEETDQSVEPVTDVDILNAHLYAGEVYSFYYDNFGRDGWDGSGESQMMSSAHYGENFINAFWDGRQMVYGDGDAMVQDDVCGHEVTHGVVQSTAGLIYLHQPGAVNEAMADIMAYFMTQDPVIGEGLRSGPFRDISDPASQGQPAHMDEYRHLPIFMDNGGVHIYSGIVSHAAYLMTAGGEKNGFTIEGQGFEISQAIWYLALTEYMMPVSNFAHARSAVESACFALHGDSAPPCVAAGAAFDAQGIAAFSFK